MSVVEFRIDNMHCGACVRQVMQTVNKLPASHAEEVRVGSARVSTDDVDAVQQALAQAGFPATLAPTQS